MNFTLRIGSRPSALAQAQATLIKDAIVRELGGLSVEIVPINTTGDKMRSAWLARIGGKGLFIRELEQALSERRIDLAVHSMKDLPAILPDQYRLAAVPRREACHDVLVSRCRGGLASLPQGARLGTSSIRRRFEALRLRLDLEVLPLRGNVDTRLRRLLASDFDAIILAAAGLKRLGLASQNSSTSGAADRLEFNQLDAREFVPAGGQGALAVEVLQGGAIAGSQEIEKALSSLTDLHALGEVTAERAFLAAIGASCVSPVGVNGTATNEALTLCALVFSVDGGRYLAAKVRRELDAVASSSTENIVRAATELGERLGLDMLEQGASDLIGRD
jgi:hydroxymethylbilane synthase